MGFLSGLPEAPRGQLSRWIHFLLPRLLPFPESSLETQGAPPQPLCVILACGFHGSCPRPDPYVTVSPAPPTSLPRLGNEDNEPQTSDEAECRPRSGKLRSLFWKTSDRNGMWAWWGRGVGEGWGWGAGGGRWGRESSDSWKVRSENLPRPLPSTLESQDGQWRGQRHFYKALQVVLWGTTTTTSGGPQERPGSSKQKGGAEIISSFHKCISISRPINLPGAGLQLPRGHDSTFHILLP